MEENTICNVCGREASSVMLRLVKHPEKYVYKEKLNSDFPNNINVCIVCKIVYNRQAIIGQQTPIFKNRSGVHYDDIVYPFYEKFIKGIMSKVEILNKLKELEVY